MFCQLVHRRPITFSGEGRTGWEGQRRNDLQAERVRSVAFQCAFGGLHKPFLGWFGGPQGTKLLAEI